MDELVDKLRNSGFRISKSTLQKYIKELMYTRKRTRTRYTRTVPSTAEAQRFVTLCESATEILSIDESSVLMESTPLYGYSRKGTRLTKCTSKNPRATRLSLILAISNTRGVVSYETVKGSVNSEIYSIFLKTIESQDAVAIMDNVRFHHSQKVKEAAEEKGIRIAYTTPYCPDWNPVENAFSVIKSKKRRFSDSLSEAIALVTPEKCKAFFRHSIQCVKERLHKGFCQGRDLYYTDVCRVRIPRRANPPGRRTPG